LTIIYAGGLRLLEGGRLQVADIDSGRMLLHIHGKGHWDRYVPLPAPILPRLRAYWQTHRSLVWLFPAPPRRGRPAPVTAPPRTRHAQQSAECVPPGRPKKWDGQACVGPHAAPLCPP
jgi:integrase